MMRRASRNKRSSSARAQEKATFSLMVHGPEYGAGEEVVINPECFPQIKVNDLVEILQPERDHQRLVLQVTSLAPVRGKLQVSVLKDIAAQFGLETLLPVTVQRAEPRDVTVDFIELSFKDQFLSRADIWRFKVAMLGKCVYVGKNVACLGIRSQVEGLLANNQDLYCGVIGADTKMIVRSRSSRLFWLVQMSAEMWEFAPDGELYYEKLLNRLLRVMISKWNESSVSHSVTIIAFSRSFYDKDQFPDDYDPLELPFSEPTRQGFGPGCTLHSGTKTASGYGPTIHVDPITGRYYEDFYKVLVMNYTGPDWNHLLGILKREFATYHETHRWRSPEEAIPADYKVHKCTKESSKSGSSGNSGAQASGNDDGTDDGDTETEIAKKDECYVQWKSLPYGIPSRAMDGNILEAINVTLNILDKHYMDRDLNRTGQSIVMITAGCSIFNVDERLAQITKQRMMDNGVGMDMISLTTPPMHVVPLFICQKSADELPFHIAQNRYQNPTEDHSARRQRNYSISSDNLSALETCSLRGLEKEISDFEQSNWGDDEAATNPANSDTSSQEDDEETTATATMQGPERVYSIPHWVNITFLDFDCRCGDEWAASGERRFPAQSQSCSPTNGSAARPQFNNRLLSHRSQACDCQYYLNQRFLPLPPFRMFDLTAPTERLSFPVALKNLIKGYPRKFQRGENHPPTVIDGVEKLQGIQQPQLRRKLSDISDAISLGSNAVFHDQLQICRSPDFEVSLSPRLKQYSSNFSVSVISREAFQDYDDEVFSASSILGLNSPEKEGQQGFSTPRRSDPDLTSATFSGDMNPMDVAAMISKNGKWNSISNPNRVAAKRSFASGGSNSIIGSLLSPRNDVSIINRQSDRSTPAFKRVSTADGLAARNHSSGISIPSMPALELRSARKSIVYPKRELQSAKEQASSDKLKKASAFGEGHRGTHQPLAVKTRGRAHAAVDSTSKPQTDLSEHTDLSPQSAGEKLLGKSVDSSRNFLASRFSKEESEPKKSGNLMRSRACTSNVEGSTTPPLAPQLLRDPGFQSLSRSMTMAKPSPSYYNDLLLRSPPASAAIASSLSASNENGSSSLRQNHVSRRGNSEVLSSSALSATIANLGNQPCLPHERSKTSLSTNPFKYSTETLETTSQRLTSDRRRWSHLFPVLTINQQHQASLGNPEVHHHGGVKLIHLGPNWKSLTSPAILPLTTDYYPSAKDLHTSYTESFYTLTLPSMQSETVPKYNDHDELLIEMVCQRLASDFQLVATDSSTDLDPAHHHVPAVITNRGPSGESRSANNTVIYYLSMGHRIHQMIYDPELQTIDVKRYFQRDIQSQKNEAKNYRYSLWVDFTKSFHPLQQKFHEYPQPEENWNSLDHLLCGYHDEMSDLTKCRRIRFAILPPKNSSSSADASANYISRFSKLMDYLQTRIAPAEDGVKEKISIRIVRPHETSGSQPQQIPRQAGTLSYKICCKSSSCSSSRIRSDDTRAEWIMIHLEDTMDVSRNYHLDMRWLACSGIVADDFVSTLKRKSKQSGLEIRRVPEYSRVSFLQIHPLIAPIFLPVPLRMLHREEGHTLNSDQEKSLITILVERLDFVLDDERLADSNGIGYGLGIEREERKPLGAGYRFNYRQQRRSASSAARLMAEKWRTRGYKQYMHRNAPVFLRLIHNGLVWVPSYDYDERSDAKRIEELFREICNVIQASATLQDLVDSCCCTEAA